MASIEYLLLVSFGLALAGGLVMVLHKLVQSQLVWMEFKRKIKGLPVYEERGWFGNHASTVTMAKNNCKVVSEVHNKLGKTFGMMYRNQPVASTVDLDLIKTCMDEPNLHLNRIRIGVPVEQVTTGCILTAENDDWRRIRRAFAPAFKSSKFKQPNVLKEIDESIGKLIKSIDHKLDPLGANEKQEAGGKGAARDTLIHADELIHRFSVNFVFSSIYKQHNLIDFETDECHWTQTIDEGLEAVQESRIFKLAIYFPILRNLIDKLIWHLHKQGQWRESIINFVRLNTKQGIEARKYYASQTAKGVAIDKDNFTLLDGSKYSRNMIDHVLDQYLAGKIDRDQYFNSSFFLFTAADKTQADSIVHTLYHLAVNKDIQNRLRESILNEGEESHYLNWVIQESLRLLPPVPAGCSRALAKDIAVKDGAYVLPAGTFLFTHTFGIHRLKEYWGEDADEFRPERWQDTSNFHPMQYIPFGFGPRMCVGKDLAMFTMKRLIMALLKRYKFDAELKHDIYTFDSPLFIYTIPNSPTYIKISRLE